MVNLVTGRASSPIKPKFVGWTRPPSKPSQPTGASAADQAVCPTTTPMYAESMPLPRMLPVRQHFPDHSIPDVRAEVLRQLTARQFASRVPAGSRIAIGVGSRGISNIATITRTAVDYWKSQGCQPFIFPSMGSHGGATAEG